ncbi:MAG: GHKL domain-containing protein [Oscillospiraceae bacterium]|nr:GHKL domain-containing protein [Oscillospiraceae bacterium]
MERLIIDIFGTGIGYFTVLLFYSTFWTRKNIRNQLFVGGVIIVAIINTGFITLFINTAVLTGATFASIFTLSFFFTSKVSYKLLLSTIITAIFLISEIPVGIMITQMFGVSAELIPEIPFMYFIGVTGSNLFTLFIVCLFRVYWGNKKQQAGRQFNLLMGFVAAMPIMVGFIVVGYIADLYIFRTPIFGLATVLFSLLLVFIIMYVLNDRLKAMEYRKQSEMARAKLEMQIEHYQKSYQAQNEVRAIRHDLSNTLIALSGLLEVDAVDEALEQIKKTNAQITKVSDIIDTGFPAMDAVLSAKFAKADEMGMTVVHKMLIGSSLAVDQVDLSLILANALDNAIEAIERSVSVDKTITLRIDTTSDCISIYIENYASEPVNKNFETSKPDKTNHGFGINQMRAIAEKYGGSVIPNYDVERGKFTLNIMLINRKI